MTNFFGYFVFGSIFLVGLIFSGLIIWLDVYHQAYMKGWKDAENWVVTLETDVDQERQKIWREEAL